MPCDDAMPDPDYITLERTHTHEYSVKADEDGQLWLLIGTDSGFEGLNTLYYLEIEVELVPEDDD